MLVLHSTAVALFERQAVLKRLTDFFAQNQIVVIHGIVGDRLELGNIHFAVFIQYGFVYGNVDDPAYQAAGFGIIGDQLTLHSHRQFINQRCVHKGGLGSVEACLGKFVRLLVTGDDAHIIAGCHILCSGHRYGKCFPRKDVLGGLVVLADTDGDLCLLADTALGGIHGVRCAVSAVSGDDVHRHRVTHGLGSEIFSHNDPPCMWLRLLYRKCPFRCKGHFWVV